MISERLIKIANMVDKNKIVFDVGSDHGLLPCFLCLNNFCDKAYAGDINQGPLNQAKKNIQKYHLQKNVFPILSAGLNNAPDDVEIVIISGMGYYTAKEIIDNCDVNKYQYFIVQINNDVLKLRQYLSDCHYTIIDETMVFDKFYYQIIKFNSDYHESYSDLQIKYGPILLDRRDQSFLNYLKYERNKLSLINEKAHKLNYERKIQEIDSILYNDFRR